MKVAISGKGQDKYGWDSPNQEGEDSLLGEHGCPSQDYSRLDQPQLKSHIIIPSIAVVLKLQHAPDSPGGLVKTQLTRLHLRSTESSSGSRA